MLHVKTHADHWRRRRCWSAVVNILASRGYAVATTVLETTEADSIHTRYGGVIKAHTVDLSNAAAALTKIKLLVDTMPAFGRSRCLRRNRASRPDGADFSLNVYQGI
jgi:hypothetical protein